jgi:hypothetical protein
MGDMMQSSAAGRRTNDTYGVGSRAGWSFSRRRHFAEGQE